jgi:hypothetical protein
VKAESGFPDSALWHAIDSGLIYPVTSHVLRMGVARVYPPRMVFIVW